jgi:hypothetical protein
VARLDDLVNIFPEHRSYGAVLLNHFGIAKDRSEDIVEVMGDTACQGADGLHLLGLLQLDLKFFSFFFSMFVLSNVGDGNVDMPSAFEQNRCGTDAQTRAMLLTVN